MRHFYKLPINVQNAPLMIQIMQTQSQIFDDEGVCKALLPDAKKVGLGILQITNGTALTGCELRRIEHDNKIPLGSATGARYIVMLSGQVMCLVDDECPAINAGEAWWIEPKAEVIIVNKSGDDAVFLSLTIGMD